MAQFICSVDASKPDNKKFIIYILDTTHLFVRPDADKTILYEINEYRKRTTYDKPEKMAE